MRLIVLSTTTLFFGALLVLYGTLLAWKPDLFLKFHDTFVDRGRNRNASWRKNVYNPDYKLLGVAFCVFGLFIIYVMFVKLISTQRCC